MPFRRTLLVYALIGPPVGWVVYAIGLIAFEAKYVDSFSKFGAELPYMLMMMPFSYLVGLIPAIAVGIAVAKIASPAFGTGLTAVTAIGILCGVLVALLFSGSPTSADFAGAGYFLLQVLTCLVPSIICWVIARPPHVELAKSEPKTKQ